MPSLTVTPNPAPAGTTISPRATGLEPKAWAYFSVVNDQCAEVKFPRARPRVDGSLTRPVTVPTMRGKYRVRVWQHSKVVADFLGTVT